VKKISWDKQAITNFREAIKYIRKESNQNADKVKSAVLDKIDDLLEHPEAHYPDKYKLNNDGNYRAFEIYTFRIGYLVKENEIIIVRIRSTKQEPANY